MVPKATSSREEQTEVRQRRGGILTCSLETSVLALAVSRCHKSAESTACERQPPPRVGRGCGGLGRECVEGRTVWKKSGARCHVWTHLQCRQLIMLGARRCVLLCPQRLQLRLQICQLSLGQLGGVHACLSLKGLTGMGGGDGYCRRELKDCSQKVIDIAAERGN